MFLGPQQKVPDEENLLNLQASFVTQVHPWLLPLYVIGAFLTMLGTLYGTVEVACSIADELVRSFVKNWTEVLGHRLRRGVISWCASVAFLILAWFFVRQSTALEYSVKASKPVATIDAFDSDESSVQPADVLSEVAIVERPRLLLSLMTPVNLFTGVFSCGVICLLTIWMDRRWLPVQLQPPLALTCLNGVAGILFLVLGIKGCIDNENRVFAISGVAALLIISLIVASQLASPRTAEPDMDAS